MTSFYALLTGFGLLAVAAVIIVLKRPPSLRRFIAVVVIAILTSVASTAVAKSRHAGTIISTSRGYPKPFFFSPGGINPLYFGVNTFVHFGAVAVIAAILPRRNREEWPSSTMPARMHAIRIILGIVFVILGIIGSLLPVLQGWLFFLIAFLLLFPKTRFTEKILVKAQPKLPRLVGWLRRNGVGRQ